MSEPPTILSKFSINDWYRFLMYIAVLFLVISFIWTIPSIELSLFRSGMTSVIIVGCVYWFIIKIEDVIVDYMKYKFDDNDSSTEGKAIIFVFLRFLIELLFLAVMIITFLNSFKNGV